MCFRWLHVTRPGGTRRGGSPRGVLSSIRYQAALECSRVVGLGIGSSWVQELPEISHFCKGTLATAYPGSKPSLLKPLRVDGANKLDRAGVAAISFDAIWKNKLANSERDQGASAGAGPATPATPTNTKPRGKDIACFKNLCCILGCIDIIFLFIFSWPQANNAQTHK